MMDINIDHVTSTAVTVRQPGVYELDIVASKIADRPELLVWLVVTKLIGCNVDHNRTIRCGYSHVLGHRARKR